MIKKVLFILFIISLVILCDFAVVYVLNLAVIGLPQKLPAHYEATEYSLISDNSEMKLTVCDETTLVGWFNNNGVIINIRIEYENYGTAYEHYTAKIYNSDTNEYIDYVSIECDGQKIKLVSKIENLDFYDPPNILDNIKKDNSIFLSLGSTIILEATE